ncbi:MAG TPA: YqzL family protein [Clostridiales bacterium]|nr:YqzL family protein [Clostridiales bacterium]
MKSFAWNLFSRTGSIEAYLCYKDYRKLIKDKTKEDE